MNIGAVPEQVQMLPAAPAAVVDRLIRHPVDRGGKACPARRVGVSGLGRRRRLADRLASWRVHRGPIS